ncbi:MAG: (2Fe-2S)-binding protein [Candidatus Eisenbacteria bacterium]|nr:(2Fe-2S)-binding protein [Candidatus Eisenbacteria bacterium]
MTPESDSGRITRHPVFDPAGGRTVRFTFNGRDLKGREGEAVSSALFAGGVRVFGHHHKDGGAQGIYCANGQCAQCTLIIDGVPLKSCVTPLREGMDVRSLEGLPELLEVPPPGVDPPERIETDVLILGAGPSGMAAAIELGKVGVRTILADDKDRLGGKLVLQTHKFFGSVEDCHAGTRGTEIARILEREIAELPDVDVWLQSIALGVYSDRTIGIRRSDGYKIVAPKTLLVSAGAREKSIVFPGCDLPGVYGAGAFQTLVNRDAVRSSDRIFVLGGGNVGLIAAYHALQADMTVVGLAEALETCGGYYVHADKIRRLGVPIYTRHTVIAAHGSEGLEAVTVAAVDEAFRPIPGTEKTYRVDTLLIAVGLDPVNEFHEKALAFGVDSRLAGDAEEIAEASAAMFSGKIRGIEIARDLGATDRAIPEEWSVKAEVLKSPGGAVHPYEEETRREGIYPILHCTQEIPCNPCMTVCPNNLIHTEDHPILGMPEFDGDCTGCMKCVTICPGLAVTLVDRRKDPESPVVIVPFELGAWRVAEGEEIAVVDHAGEALGRGRLLKILRPKSTPGTLLLRIEAPAAIANRIAGVRVQSPEETSPEPEPWESLLADDAILCRCERVTVGEIRSLLRGGVRDMNEIKALTRCGYGACGGKTCRPLLARLCREEGIPDEEITPFTDRPLFAETPLGWFSGGRSDR